ncbi:protein Skeletor, isoforms B/C isoform X3 [Diorhabda carinulata]|uniref:protein Skeletor, isoforms B/C isoform X3 n=1 Tax=Diorhabda carinulata TaxID=1163345 RepID=UPI0025A059C8|nr:protein Skeletor, isoforms B/C isoform X3 [Diorhabda carinulata]
MKNKMAVPWALFLIGIVSAAVENCHGAQYFGKLIGKLSELHHGVSGEVYAVDARTLFIKDFTYDGQGPAAYFYASVHKTADKNGFRLRDETGSGAVIRRYRKEGIALTLPEGKTIHNIKIFYLWCEEFDVNFGDVKIPRNFDYPRPQKIDPLTGVHAVSSDNVVIVDAQTLLIPNFSYDGEAPDAKFWVGKGSRPTPQGYRVPDENGKESPLRKYDRKTIVLTLPGDLTVFDIGHFGVWCEEFTVDFGHILIPQILNIPPSLKMLGISPQKLQQTDDSKSPRPTVSHSRPFVGGHLQATTYRPPLLSFFGIGRRNDNNHQSTVNHVPGQLENIPLKQNHQLNNEELIKAQYQPLNFQLIHQNHQNQINNQQQIQSPFINQNSQFQQTYQQHRFNQPQHSQYQQLKPYNNYNGRNIDIQKSISHQIVPNQVYQVQQAAQYSNPQINFQQYLRNGRQYDEQFVYDRILQEKRLRDEQQLQAQLDRQYNRFQFNGYNQLG